MVGGIYSIITVEVHHLFLIVQKLLKLGEFYEFTSRKTLRCREQKTLPDGGMHSRP